MKLRKEERSALSIANELGSIAESTKNKDAVIESLKTIEKYEEDTAIVPNPYSIRHVSSIIVHVLSPSYFSIILMIHF